MGRRAAGGGGALSRVFLVGCACLGDDAKTPTNVENPPTNVIPISPDSPSTTVKIIELWVLSYETKVTHNIVLGVPYTPRRTPRSMTRRAREALVGSEALSRDLDARWTRREAGQGTSSLPRSRGHTRNVRQSRVDRNRKRHGRRGLQEPPELLTSTPPATGIHCNVEPPHRSVLLQWASCHLSAAGYSGWAESYRVSGDRSIAPHVFLCRNWRITAGNTQWCAIWGAIGRPLHALAAIPVPGCGDGKLASLLPSGG